MLKALDALLVTGITVMGAAGASDSTLYARAVSLPEPVAATAAFHQGLVDHQAWQDWLDATSGNYRTGAFYWSGERNSAHPGSCEILTGSVRNGCLAARTLLDPFDARRTSEPDYRPGWNSFEG
jgi:hypothetical protein